MASLLAGLTDDVPLLTPFRLPEVKGADEILERILADLNPSQAQAFDVERLGALAFTDGASQYSIPEIGISAGYGSGKTYVAHAVAVKLSMLNQGFTGCVMEPTKDMVRRIWVPKFEDFLDHYGIQYTARYHPYTQHVLHLPLADTKVLGLSFENYGRIVGDDWAWAIIDEVDTAKTSIAQRAYDKVIGRIRVGNFQQLHCYSTPEGYGFHYQTFGTETARAGKRRALLQMRTADNAQNLRPGFVDDLMARYTPEQCKAYLEGIYQNLETGSVYNRFSRDRHLKPIEWDEDETILMGCDFNVANCNAVLAVRRGRELFVFDEVSGAHDTDAMGQEIRRRYPSARILGYPDASGASRSTNSSRSDVAILDSYDISNQSPKANPPVRDRVNAVQAALENGKGETRLWIDPRCKKLTECLELQCWTEKGEPDKDAGYDHANDALGYMVHRIFEVGRPSAGRAVRGVRVY
jgi:hypothetical protein